VAPGRTFVIFNPASGRGRGAKRIRRYLDLLGTHLPGCEHGATTRAGEEAELAGRAVAEGFDTVVAVGGDGTWSHVADALVRETRDAPERRPRFGVLPSGTGNDFGRSLGLDYADMEAAVIALASGRTRKVDVGHVLTACRPDREPDAEAADRYFLNLVGFGFDVAVIDAAAGARLLRGELLYKATALSQLFRFPGFDVEVTGAGGAVRRGSHLMITVSNGRYFGGGFPIAPDATVEDGRLHACLIGDAPPFTRFGLFNAAGKGRHVESGRVEVVDDTRFALAFGSPPRFEVDGDVFVSSQAVVEVEVMAGALDVVA
jgi:diacylglycerol kinase (ATP)